jgi:hypothetical protein
VIQGAPQPYRNDDVVPDDLDIVFGEERRKGTKLFLKHVASVAKKHPTEEYRPFIYRECKEPFENRNFYSMDVEGMYKELSRDEAIGLIGKTFADAKIRMREKSDRSVKSSSRSETEKTEALTNSLNSIKSRSIRSIDSTGSVHDLPCDDDIIIENFDHPGTRRFFRQVRRIAKDQSNEEYSPAIYRSIKKSFEGCTIYRTTDKGAYRKIEKSELVAIVGEAFEYAKNGKCPRSTRSIRSRIDVVHGSPDDISSLGESFLHPSEKNVKHHKRSLSRSSSKSVRGIQEDKEGSSKAGKSELKHQKSDHSIYKGIPLENDHSSKSKNKSSIQKVNSSFDLTSSSRNNKSKSHWSERSVHSAILLGDSAIKSKKGSSLRRSRSVGDFAESCEHSKRSRSSKLKNKSSIQKVNSSSDLTSSSRNNKSKSHWSERSVHSAILLGDSAIKSKKGSSLRRSRSVGDLAESCEHSKRSSSLSSKKSRVPSSERSRSKSTDRKKSRELQKEFDDLAKRISKRAQ